LGLINDERSVPIYYDEVSLIVAEKAACGFYGLLLLEVVNIGFLGQ